MESMAVKELIHAHGKYNECSTWMEWNSFPFQNKKEIQLTQRQVAIM